MKILNHPNIGKKLSVGLTMMLKHVLKFAPDAREHTSRSTGEAEPFDVNASISSIKASNVGASIIFKRSGSVDVADGIPQKRLRRPQERHYNYRNNWQHLRKPPRAPAPRRCALSPSSIPPRLYLAEQPSAAHHTLSCPNAAAKKETASGPCGRIGALRKERSRQHLPTFCWSLWLSVIPPSLPLWFQSNSLRWSRLRGHCTWWWSTPAEVRRTLPDECFWMNTCTRQSLLQSNHVVL